MPKQGLDRDKILQTAIALADRQGISDLSLKALADELGIKTPSLYNHIDGLPGLYALMAVYGLEGMKNALTEASEGLVGDSALFAMGRAYLSFARQHPGLYAVTQRPDLWESSEAEALNDELWQGVRAVIGSYNLAEPILTHVTRLFRSLFHGFITLEQSGGFDGPVNSDDTFLAIMATLLSGIKANYIK